ncbi:MAG: pyrroloquinoline quinone-dependent dehydrogenase [Gemmatimonadales bacterium]
MPNNSVRDQLPVLLPGPRRFAGTILAAWLIAAGCGPAPDGADDLRAENWPAWGRDPGASKYSPLATIDRSNVSHLVPAWEWRPGEQPIPAGDSTLPARPGLFQATPIALNDTLYLSTGYNQVAALDGATGRELWRFDPDMARFGQPPNGTGFVHRGVATWTDGRTRRIFLNTRWRLIALDAATGQPVPGFGTGGEVDLTADLSWTVNRLHYTNTSPPVVFGDLVIVGNGVGDRLIYRNDPPGDVQAFNVRTGERVWRWSPIPQPGEPGHDTWEGDSWRYTGHTNVWAPMSLDAERGLLFLPVSTPSNDFYGGGRKGANLYAESLVALDARTGERRWHFQIVHHGVWDYDLPTAPVLAERNGRPVVIQLTKQGFAFVFDRETGTPVWPIEERPVPASDVPGEGLSATQPFPTRPAPFARQGFTDDDLIDFTPELRALARRAVAGFRMGSLYTPPSLQGTILMPGLIGGGGWGGGAVDPATGTIYVKATNSPAVIRLYHPPQSDSVQGEYTFDRSASLRFGDPTAREIARLGGTPDGLPLNKPPYGTLTAIDLATGDHRWQVPAGVDRSIEDHPLVRPLGLGRLGSAGAPGPMATAGGLVFATGGGSALEAFDAATGELLWSADLGGRGYANPMTYATRDGRQFVAIASGGGANAVLKVFTLPAR